MLIVIFVVLYLAMAVRYYENSVTYTEVFKEMYENQQGRPMTLFQGFVLGACYIFTCLLWPIYGRGLKKFWQ